MKKSSGILVTVCAVTVAVSIGFVVYFSSLPKHTGLEMEDNATVGIMEGVDLEARKKELQEKLDRSKIAFSVNTSPLFVKGEGNLMIENPGNNAKLLVAEVILKDQTEPVYRSGALKPGTYLESVTLDKPLLPGTYDATVYLQAYDETTQEFIGQTGAEVTLTIAE